MGMNQRIARQATVTGAVVASLVLAGCSRPEPAAEPVRAVRTQVVALSQAAASHEYAADVRARIESRLGFRVGGKIVERRVGLGDPVKAGQVLARLDPADFRLAQEAAGAALVAAEANEAQALADIKRFRELRDQGFISSADLERRETALKAAQAQVLQARAQAGAQGNQTGYALLTAPAGGVVTAVDAEPGMVMSSGTTVLRLAHDGPRDVVFAVPEDRIGGLRALVGQPGLLTARLWGSTESLPLVVREVAAAADPVTRTFLVKADAGPRASTVLKLGQSATVRLEMPKVEGVVRLPLTALRQDPGGSAVWLVDPATMTVRSQRVQVAGADGNLAVIAGGLAEGQRVVTAGVHVLTPGQKVTLYAEPRAAGAAPAAAPAASAPRS
jgi:membrane fusion protein, multidrug efflux system